MNPKYDSYNLENNKYRIHQIGRQLDENFMLKAVKTEVK